MAKPTPEIRGFDSVLPLQKKVYPAPIFFTQPVSALPVLLCRYGDVVQLYVAS